MLSGREIQFRGPVPKSCASTGPVCFVMGKFLHASKWLFDTFRISNKNKQSWYKVDATEIELEATLEFQEPDSDLAHASVNSGVTHLQTVELHCCKISGWGIRN